jgi:hypothetical protein
MILIAATAAGLALSESNSPIKSEIGWVNQVEWGIPLLACWTFSALLIRLRRPRPCFRRLLRQPGAASVFVALAVFVPWSGLLLVLRMMRGNGDLEFTTVPTGSALLATWLILGVTRAFRTDRSGIDRLGLVIGVCWILELVVVVYEVLPK